MKTIIVIIMLVLVPAIGFACLSDHECDISYKCVKAFSEIEGRCMQVEKAYGIPDYDYKPQPFKYNENPPVADEPICPAGYYFSEYYQRCIR